MNPERWQRIKDLFAAAITRTGDERAKFLTAHTDGDPGLRSEVESLLASWTPGEDDEAAVVVPFRDNEGLSFPDKMIGVYTVVREIGRGGMGIVYEGLREREFKQRVAIKLIRRGLGSEETLRRFHTERSALARLEHPGIARLLDGGNLPDGTPYFVMEYVEGVPIDVYCDEKKLTIRERLELFRAVCSAVHYAHQHLIVHRDLKPGNIFVTPTGVKLLDFGIAKLLDPDSSDMPISQTQQGARFFTPEYASPEQILGGNITTASDTYSLGVLLYKLLTGQRPYRFKSPSLSDVEQAILDTQPTRPSKVVLKAEPDVSANRSISGTRLMKMLSGDLDTMVLKALQKERERRYSSVQQFEEDVRRYLAGLPVSAQRDSLGYRFAKLVGRNRIAATASVIALLLLAAGITTSLWQASRAERERDRAQAESEKAKQVISVLNEMLSAADPTHATTKDVTVAEVLEQASQRVERDFTNQPGIAADLLATIGSTYQGLQLFEKAGVAKQKVLDLQRVVYGNEHPRVAEALRSLGEFHHLQENRAVAESLYGQSLTIFRVLNEPSREYATALNDYGVFLQDEGKYPLADSLFGAALTMYRQIPGDNRREIAASLHNLALNHDWQNQLSTADSLYRESLLLQQEVYGNNNVQIAITIGNLGFIAEGQGNVQEAERLFRESLAIRRALLSENHSDVSANKIKLGLFLADHTSEYQEAEGLCRDALTSLITHNPNLKRLIARAYLGIGRALQKQGRIPEAEQELKHAVTHFEQMQPFSAQSIADARLSLAENLIRQRRFHDAETQLLKTQDLMREVGARDAIGMKKAETLLVELYSLWKPQ